MFKKYFYFEHSPILSYTQCIYNIHRLGPRVQGPFYGYPILWEKIVFVVKKYFLKIFCSLAHSGGNVKYIILYMCVIYVCFRVVYYLFLCPLVFKVFIYNYLIFNVLYRSLFLSFNCGIP